MFHPLVVFVSWDVSKFCSTFCFCLFLRFLCMCVCGFPYVVSSLCFALFHSLLFCLFFCSLSVFSVLFRLSPICFLGSFLSAFFSVCFLRSSLFPPRSTVTHPRTVTRWRDTEMRQATAAYHQAGNQELGTGRTSTHHGRHRALDDGDDYLVLRRGRISHHPQTQQHAGSPLT